MQNKFHSLSAPIVSIFKSEFYDLGNTTYTLFSHVTCLQWISDYKSRVSHAIKERNSNIHQQLVNHSIEEITQSIMDYYFKQLEYFCLKEYREFLKNLDSERYHRLINHVMNVYSAKKELTEADKLFLKRIQNTPDLLNVFKKEIKISEPLVLKWDEEIRHQKNHKDVAKQLALSQEEFLQAAELTFDQAKEQGLVDPITNQLNNKDLVMWTKMKKQGSRIEQEWQKEQLNNSFSNIISEFDSSHTPLEQLTYDMESGIDSSIISDSQKRIHQARLSTIADMNDCDTAYLQQYEISHIEQNVLDALGLVSSQFKFCQGNKLQQLLHKEAIANMRQAVNLHNKYENIAQIRNFADTSLTVTARGVEYNKQGRVDLAASANDAAYCLLAFVNGITTALGDNVQDICHAIEHPVEFAESAAAATYQLTKFLSHVVSVYDAIALGPNSNRTTQLLEEQHQYGQFALKVINHFYNDLTTEQKFEYMGKFIGDWVVFPGASGKVLKTVSLPSKIEVANSIVRMGEFANSLGAVGQEGMRLFGLALEKGHRPVLAGFEYAQRYPSLQAGTTYAFEAAQNGMKTLNKLERYYNAVVQKNNILSRKGRWRQFFEKSGILECGYLPPIAEQTSHTSYHGKKILKQFSQVIGNVYVDAMGNEWWLKQGKIHLSSTGIETFGHLCNDRTAILKFEEFEKAILETPVVRSWWWGGLEKVDYNGTKCAKIGNRLYYKHAIDRMIPEGFGCTRPIWAKSLNGIDLSEAKQLKNKFEVRGIPPMVVESIIKDGIVISKRICNGVERIERLIDNISVVLEGDVVVTIKKLDLKETTKLKAKLWKENLL
ncbi:hypothetical protein A3F06_03955 [candidate division TM6 bacterium RIFCSPHIGHO2_12_FULL_36_22]|nr:MAG: hypothetical protein A3F06_03955 [candidate division TM6 bacterium RIFCSPHIGHO2_12_FULL_36_22]